MSWHSKYKDKLSCFALSTAFEDFELNTIENTRLLLKKNILVGETKKEFDARNLKWEAHIPFPVLIDTMTTRAEMLQPHYIEGVISNHRQFGVVSQPELAQVKVSLQNYFNHYEQCGLLSLPIYCVELLLLFYLTAGWRYSFNGLGTWIALRLKKN
ncbi:hypothetical protein [Imperialibacter sp.]|uniref:hypothetical protein n=1 Tax=Imperialibacter sp. TaxID=2038411 RepID=UPI0032EEEFE9